MIIIYLIVATYLFLIINMNIGPQAPDLLFMLLYFVAYNQSLDFALIFGFWLGLLTDLIYPSRLGIYTLTYTLLPAAVQFLKIRLYQSILSVLFIFVIVFILKVVAIGLITKDFRIFPAWSIFYSLIFFLPIFLVLNQILFGLWMKKL